MSPRGVALIAVAFTLSAGLLGLQLASGGADFVPQRPADPCQDRGSSVKQDFQSLAETVVLTGIDVTACKLGVSRERLLLALPSKRDRLQLARASGTDDRGLAHEIEDGLATAVARLEKAGRLPRMSALVRSTADQLGLSKTLVDLIPDSLIDDLPATADVLRWSLAKIDVHTGFVGLDDRKSFEAVLRDALVEAAIDEATKRVDDIAGGVFHGGFG